MMTMTFNANDINFLSSIGVVNADKATKNVQFIKQASKDRLKRYDYSKPDNSKAIADYVGKIKQQLHDELDFY
jgi:hypothetical protein